MHQRYPVSIGSGLPHMLKTPSSIQLYRRWPVRLSHRPPPSTPPHTPWGVGQVWWSFQAAVATGWSSLICANIRELRNAQFVNSNIRAGCIKAGQTKGCVAHSTPPLNCPRPCPWCPSKSTYQPVGRGQAFRTK
eukprot:7384139-Prymnesium_polylepis.3